MLDSLFLLNCKMGKELFREIEIPEGVNVEIEGNTLIAKGNGSENRREFKIHKLELEKKGNKIVVGALKSTKNEKRNMNTIAAHIKNMIKGLNEKFEYHLKVCTSHFPFTVEVKGREVLVKNFLGEKVPRKIMMPEGVDVKVAKDIITIKSSDKEKAGQAAANLERVTQITNRDRRIFQDGIYITQKNGREI